MHFILQGNHPQVFEPNKQKIPYKQPVWDSGKETVLIENKCFKSMITIVI